MLGSIAVCAGLRVWLAHNADLIARDGIVYLEMAKKWSSSPSEVMLKYDYPPGYPVAISAAHWGVRQLGATESRELWEQSGRGVSVVASLLALLAVGILAGRAFNWPIAIITVLLFGVSKKWAILNSDVLSDSLALCFQLWALVLASTAATLLDRKSNWFYAALAGSGILAGGGYLVRPESLWVLALAGALLGGRCILKRRDVIKSAAGMILMACCASVIVLPYATFIGGLSNKDSVDKMVLVGQDPMQLVFADDAPSTFTMAGSCPMLGSSELKPPRVITKFMEAVHPLLGGLCFIYVGLLALWRWRPKAIDDSLLPRLSGVGLGMMLAAAGILMPTLTILYDRVGYLSHRHVMLLATLLCPLSAAAVVVAARILSLGAMKLRLNLGPQLFTGLGIAAIFAGLLGNALREPHGDKLYIRQAGLELKTMAVDGDVVLADSLWVPYYAQAKALHFDTKAARAGELWNTIGTNPSITYVALADEELLELSVRDPSLRNLDIDPRLGTVLVTHRSGKNADRMSVYRVNRQAFRPATSAPASCPTSKPGLE